MPATPFCRTPACLLPALFVVLPLACTPAALLAQPVPDPNFNIGDAVREAQVPRTPPRPAQQAAPLVVQEAQVPMTLGEGQTITVADFRVEGADFLAQADVQTQLAPFRNRPLTMQEIHFAASRITALSRNQGYLVAQAYVPRQAMQDGILTIQLLVGEYGNFEMDNHSLVRASRLHAIFDRAKQASPTIHHDSLERPMLLVHDLPGARMPLVTIAPGTAPGTSDFSIKTDAGPRVQGYAMFDNYGSRFTGKNRTSFGLDVNSPLGLGDRLSASGMTSKAAGLQSGRLAWGLPLNANGLRGELAASRTTYKLGDEYADLDATGTATAIDFTLSYPFKRTRQDSIWLSVNFARKRLKDEYFNGATRIEKEADVMTLSARREIWGSLLGRGMYLNLDGGLTVGHLDFEDAVQEAQNRAGADTVGTYAKLNLSAVLNLGFNERWSLGSSLRVQRALGKNLDGSEQLSASGSGGIKAYPDGVSGDTGFIANAELRYALPRLFERLEHNVGLFADYGSVKTADGSYANLRRVGISDVGLSWTVMDKYLFGRMQLAKTTGSRAETRRYNHETQFHAHVGVRF